jgi:small multidrug resistance pump
MEKYLFLIAAILLEVAGTLMLPLTDSFSKLVPSVVLAVFYLG